MGAEIRAGGIDHPVPLLLTRAKQSEQSITYVHRFLPCLFRSGTFSLPVPLVVPSVLAFSVGSVRAEDNKGIHSVFIGRRSHLVQFTRPRCLSNNEHSYEVAM